MQRGWLTKSVMARLGQQPFDLQSARRCQRVSSCRTRDEGGCGDRMQGSTPCWPNFLCCEIYSLSQSGFMTPENTLRCFSRVSFCFLAARRRSWVQALAWSWERPSAILESCCQSVSDLLEACCCRPVPGSDELGGPSHLNLLAFLELSPNQS